MCCLSNKFKLDETFLSTLYLLKGTVEVSAHSSCKIFCTFQSQLSDNGKYGTCVHMCAKVCFLAQVMSGQKGWWKSVNGVWMHWESEEQDEQSYQVVYLGSRQGSDCHTHTVLSVLVIGEDV